MFFLLIRKCKTYRWIDAVLRKDMPDMKIYETKFLFYILFFPSILYCWERTHLVIEYIVNILNTIVYIYNIQIYIKILWFFLYVFVLSIYYREYFILVIIY